ncbi:hypothetical protein SK128_007515 [Halocaridina rubra]|uniref:Uncharacterized protein n=1 Tax=Halocaridina rubra TaxID=373956 RepID=A0AAN9A6E5_HALRR
MAMKSVSFSQLSGISSKVLKEVPPMFSPISISTSSAATTVVTTSSAPLKKIVGSTVVTPVGWNKRGRPTTKPRPVLHSLSAAKLTSNSQGASLSTPLGSVINLGSSNCQVGGRGIMSSNTGSNSKNTSPISTSIILSSSDAGAETHQLPLLRGANGQGPRGGNTGVRVYSGSPKASPPSFLLTNVSTASGVRMATPSMVITNAMNLQSGSGAVSATDSNSLPMSVGSVVVSAGGITGTSSVVGAGRGRVILTSSPRLVRPFVSQGSRTLAPTRSLSTRPTVMLVTSATPPSTTTSIVYPLSRKATTLTTSLTPTTVSNATNHASSLTVASSVPISTFSKTTTVPTGELALLVAASEMSERVVNTSLANDPNAKSIGNTTVIGKSLSTVLTPLVSQPQEISGGSIHDDYKAKGSQTLKDNSEKESIIEGSSNIKTTTLSNFKVETNNTCQAVSSSPPIFTSVTTANSVGQACFTIATGTKHISTSAAVSTVSPVCSTILTTSKKLNVLNIPAGGSTIKQTGTKTTIITSTTTSQGSPTIISTTTECESGAVIKASASTTTTNPQDHISLSISKGAFTTVPASSKTIITSSSAKSENSNMTVNTPIVTSSSVNSLSLATKSMSLSTGSTSSNLSIFSDTIPKTSAVKNTTPKLLTTTTSASNLVITSKSKYLSESEVQRTISTSTSANNSMVSAANTITKMTINTSGVNKVATNSTSSNTSITGTSRSSLLGVAPKTTIITSSSKTSESISNHGSISNTVTSMVSSENESSTSKTPTSGAEIKAKTTSAMDDAKAKAASVPVSSSKTSRGRGTGHISTKTSLSGSAKRSSSAVPSTSKGHAASAVTRTINTSGGVANTRSRRSIGSSSIELVSSKRTRSESSDSTSPRVIIGVRKGRGRPKGRRSR